MNWIILIVAGFFESGFAFCLGKMKEVSGTEWYLWGAGFLVCLALNMVLLAKAVQTLPIGTAYPVWTGIGAVGTVLVCALYGKQSLFRLRQVDLPDKGRIPHQQETVQCLFRDGLGNLAQRAESQHDYHIRVVTDAVAGSSDEAHRYALKAIRYLQRNALVTVDDIEKE